MVSTAGKSGLYNPKAGEEALLDMSANVGKGFPHPAKEGKGKEGQEYSKDPSFYIFCYRFKGIISMLLWAAVQSLAEAFTSVVFLYFVKEETYFIQSPFQSAFITLLKCIWGAHNAHNHRSALQNFTFSYLR